MVARLGIDAYPVDLSADDNETVLVTFPDFPEAATFGDDEDEALRHAIDALETAIMGRMSDREDIPYPTRPRGVRRFVALSTLSSAKVALYRTMREQSVRKAELARRMHCDFRQVDRLLDLRHHSRLDQLDAAFAALGKRLTVDLHDAPVSGRSGPGDSRRTRRRA